MNIDKEKFKWRIRYLSSNIQNNVIVDLCNSEINPVGCNECDNNTSVIQCSCCIHKPGLIDGFRPKQKEWYEKPESFPCLCWVHDDDREKKLYIYLISKFCIENTYNFKGSNSVKWKYATPLTKKEVLQYCVGGNND